jgi:hypothetical protein
VQNYGIIPGFDLFIFTKEKRWTGSTGCGPRNGGRSTVDPRPGPGDALAGAWLASAAEPRSSPRVGEKGEELRGVLTEGFGGRFDGEARPAAVKGERWW